MNNLLFTILLFCSSISLIRSQDGILFNSEMAQDGYVLCTHDFNTYLIDQCGHVVNAWSVWNTDFHAKLSDEGHLYFIQDGHIIERDWEDNIVVEIEHNIPELKLVYDLIKMSNGNYLVNCRWAINQEELAALGWTQDLGGTNLIDGIVEINPEGEVVWAWNIKDHTVQDQLPTGTNFASVEDNPQLMNIRAISTYDWQFGEAFMFNGIDYNEDLDLILISVRKMSEFIIIDHSTTTEEATGNTGGAYEKGGDILYRWGNPQNYHPNTTAERKLYYQHNPNWIEYGEHKGGIIVFNNGLSTTMGSSVIIVNPETDSNGHFLMEDSIYAPAIPSREIGYEVFDYRYSDFTSGAKVMENGNIYITSGEWDQFIEVTPEDEIAWNYKLEGVHYTYRTEKYPESHLAFLGKDLIPMETIEIPSSDYECMNFSVGTDNFSEEPFSVSIVQNDRHLDLNLETYGQFTVRFFDLMGRKILTRSINDINTSLDISNIQNQLVIVQIENGKHQSINRKIYLK